MTVITLSRNGFSVKGHCTANGDDELGRLVCASVSSAAYMAVNTITDVVGDNADISLDEKNGNMVVDLKSVSNGSKIILEGFKLHMQGLVEQYPNCIKVISEV